jgi:diaminohydroxyphosphoribosylaminopyrimidine deaminase/5-amino-6-(5-phosphoribosylamino)uracil reductase
VKDGKVAGAAYTADGGRPHAETIALEKAGEAAKGATVYVTLEPCSHHGKTPPCAEALVKAGVARVVVACEDPDPRVSGRGIQMLKDAGIDVVVGVLEQQAQKMNAGFFMKVKEGRPFITLKVATSKNDKIAAARLSGHQQFITGDMARAHGHIMRSMNDAILVGVGTVLADNPLLTTRLEGHPHTITRIVLDRHLKTTLDANLIKTAHEAPVWYFYEDDKEGRAPLMEEAGVRLFKVGTDLKTVIKTLADEGITRLLVEGGSIVHEAFVKEGLGDRLLWYRAPRDIDSDIKAFGGMEQTDVIKALGLIHVETRPYNEDLLEIYEKPA